MFKEVVIITVTFFTTFVMDKFLSKQPLFSVNKHALQIIVCYDDVEVSNPLGSYRGLHKLG